MTTAIPDEGSVATRTPAAVQDHISAELLLEAQQEHDPLLNAAGRTPIAAPRTLDEVRDLMVAANREGWRVRPAGSGAALPPAFVDDSVDLVITTGRLKAVQRYSPADLTLTADAGVTLATIETTTGESGQWLPLDPPARPRRTLGGVLATGDNGPLHAGFGSPRDHVLGLTLVTGDGRVLVLGGQVVKNVAGYDLVKLTVGSRGRLGIIVGATVRLHPVPAQDVTLLFQAPGLADGVGLARALAAAHVHIAALELVAPGTGLEGWDDSRTIAEHGGATVAARVLSSAESLADTERILTDAAGRQPDHRLDGAASARWFSRLEEAGGPTDAVVRVGSAPSRLVDLLDLCDGAERVAAHVAGGTVRAFYEDATDPSGTLATAAALGTLRDRVADMEGSLRVVRIGDVPWPRPEPAASPAVREIIDGIIHAFDPAGVLGSAV